jgi:RNA 2',3'-cyclic 3'-phosphodiesterase
MAETARLFTALWPDEAVRRDVLAQRALWQWPPGTRPVVPDKLHVTLHFLGSQPIDTIPALQIALAGAVEPFALWLDDVAVWDNGVALLAPSHLPPELSALHHRQAIALKALGLRVDVRRFQPHLTLARDARGATPPLAPLPITWRVQQTVLVQSMPDGRYVPIGH